MDQADARVAQRGGGGFLDAADGVEVMEGRGHRSGVAVDAGGVAGLGGQADLLGQLGKLADQIQLGGIGQQGRVEDGRIGVDAVFLQGAQDALAAGMGILDVIDGILAVLPHGQIQVEVKGGIGYAGIEEEASRIDGDLVQQVAQGDGLAGALGHAHHLAALH